MLLKKFYINIIIRILCILASCFAIALCFIWKPDWLIIINIAFLIGIQVVLLVAKINKLNTDLESFFAAMQSNDSNIIFSGKKNSPFLGLYQQLEKINNDFQKLKIENHLQNEYFRVLVEHVNIGLISYNNEDEITLYNRTAKELLGKRNLFKISDLEEIQSGLSAIIKDIKPSDQRLVTLYSNSGILQLSLRTAFIKFHDNSIKLVSFQNIRNELDEKELESWQKLIRVLTHELMNSAGPINSTIATIKEFLVDADGSTKKIESLTDHIIDDTIEGLKIIEERSQGMVDFVSKFRSLTLLPKPVFTTINIIDLFRTIELLMAEKIYTNKIFFETTCTPSDIKVTADKGMMEQVLINLVGNAILAVEGSKVKHIKVSAFLDYNQRPIIQVHDNGVGIPLDIQDKVFIPFFTTRKDGSGIGLSLSRQLVRLLGGTLTFTSKPGEETMFTVKL